MDPTSTTVPLVSWASRGISTDLVTPWMVRSPVAVTDTFSPSAAPAPSSIGSVSENVAVGNWPVSSASWTLEFLRELFVVMVVRSTSMSADVTVVPSITTVPVTSPVRPTASVAPTEASSSEIRNPAKVPVADSKSNSPVSASTVQVPEMSPSAGVGGAPVLRRRGGVLRHRAHRGVQVHLVGCVVAQEPDGPRSHEQEDDDPCSDPVLGSWLHGARA